MIQSTEKLKREITKYEYLYAVSSLGCAVCRRMGYAGTPAELHHPARSTDVIPLCPEHHRGKLGFHGLGKRKFEKHYGYKEDDLLADTHSLLEKGC